jgi:hypothetical protein
MGTEGKLAYIFYSPREPYSVQVMTFLDKHKTLLDKLVLVNFDTCNRSQLPSFVTVLPLLWREKDSKVLVEDALMTYLVGLANQQFDIEPYDMGGLDSESSNLDGLDSHSRFYTSLDQPISTSEMPAWGTEPPPPMSVNSEKDRMSHDRELKTLQEARDQDFPKGLERK